MENNDDLKISDEMIGSDEPNSWINWCVTIADKMIIAGEDNTGGSKAVKKMAESSQRKIKK